MQRQHTHKFRFKKINYHLKPLTPVSFLSDEAGACFSRIKETSFKSIYDRARAELDSKQPEKSEPMSEDQKSFLQSLINKSLFPNRKIDCERTLYILVLKIIKISCNVFIDQTTVSNDQAIIYDQLSRRYGKPPIDLLMPGGGYTDLDAWMFNTHVLKVGKEQDEINRQKIKAKLRRGR